MHAIETDGFSLKVACLNQSGKFEKLDFDQAVDAVFDESKLVWINVVVQDEAKVRDFLIHKMRFHELAVEDAMNDMERPSLHDFPDHLFLAASHVIRTKNEHEEYQEIGMFLRATALVTVVQKPLPLLDTWFERFERQPHGFEEAAAFLMHAIVDNVVDEYFVAIDALEDEVDELADDLYGGDTKRVGSILKLKKRLLEMRRHITPTRDILNGLLRHDINLIPAAAKLYFQDVYDHTLRIAEIADVNRDTLTSLLDVHLSTVSNSLNEVMKKMTVISTVLMSAALIAGIYGMNFKYMPELNWIDGYPFALILMVGSGFAILGLFKWKKWL